MDEQKKQDFESKPADSLRQMFIAFGEAFGEVLNDPELKAKAKEMGDAATYSAARLARRLKDEEVKDRFRKAGDAAEVFGRSVADYFKSDKDKEK
jgi:hypothetical protein